MSDHPPRALSRRAFLRLAGLAGLTGAATGCATVGARPTPGASPGIAPGPAPRAGGEALADPLRTVRSVCRECPAGCGVTAYLRGGRVTALAANPEDPVSGGMLCARGLAARQGLEAPDRLLAPLGRCADGALAPLAWAEAEERLARALAAARSAGPGAIRLLTRPEPGSVGALQRAFLRALGEGDQARLVLDPFDASPLRAANQALFGLRQLPVYRVSAANLVVSFGADFRDTWLSPAGLASGLAAGQLRLGEGRTRLAWVGPRPGRSGAAADLWVPCRAGEEPAVALSALRWLTDPSHAEWDLSPVAAELWPRLRQLDPEDLALRAGVERALLDRLAEELARRRPSALLGPGTASQGRDATQLSALLSLLDVVLWNVGETVLHGLDAEEDPATPYAEVAGAIEELARGRVQVLLVHRTDPAGLLPAVLGAAAALGRVPLVACFAERPDATTALAQLVLPDQHALESHVDAVARVGVVNLGAPAVEPRGDTRAASRVLLEVARLLPFPAARFPWADPAGYWQARLEKYALSQSMTGRPPDPAALTEAVRRGGMWRVVAPAPVALRPNAAAPFLEPPPARPAVPGGLDLVPFPAGLDGQEGGEPAQACLELSPAGAARLGVASGQLVRVTTSSGAASLPVRIEAALRDDAAGVPVGPAATLALRGGRPEDRSGAERFLGEVALLTR